MQGFFTGGIRKVVSCFLFSKGSDRVSHSGAAGGGERLGLIRAMGSRVPA